MKLITTTIADPAMPAKNMNLKEPHQKTIIGCIHHMAFYISLAARIELSTGRIQEDGRLTAE